MTKTAARKDTAKRPKRPNTRGKTRPEKDWERVTEEVRKEEEVRAEKIKQLNS